MTSAQTRDFLSGQLHHVDIQSIEKELYKLWEEAEHDRENSSAITRACALNFIAFTSTENGELNIEDIVSEIAVKHPSRAIIASSKYNDKESDVLDAWVTARCHQVPGKPRQQICCEQIIVDWKGQNTGNRRLVSVIAPLTIPDLPTCLWWHDPVLNLDVIRPFLIHVDRFIVDSRSLVEGSPSIIQLQNLKTATEEGSAVYDLNWFRLHPWRHALANSFDSNRGLLKVEDLDIISSLEIVEEANTTGSDNGKTVPGAQSWLMLGWLASRLSWDFESIEEEKEGIKIYYRLNRTRIKVILRSRREPSAAEHQGRLAEIRVNLRDRDSNLLRIWPDSNSPGLRTALLEHDSIDEMDISHNPPSKVDLIDSILNDPVKPKTFEAAVDAACIVARQMR